MVSILTGTTKVHNQIHTETRVDRTLMQLVVMKTAEAIVEAEAEEEDVAGWEAEEGAVEEEQVAVKIRTYINDFIDLTVTGIG